MTFQFNQNVIIDLNATVFNKYLLPPISLQREPPQALGQHFCEPGHTVSFGIWHMIPPHPPKLPGGIEGQTPGLATGEKVEPLRFFQKVWWSIWPQKIFQSVLCPTQLFQWKLICTFNQQCLSYKISNRLQFNSSLFPHKMFKFFLHWHTFFNMPHLENTFK